uniref:SWIM-type domain-containing protein n=1 Tax=Panagrolaimus sp. JU765 TaxID=591449 RepID=A0AC34PWV3_9BILA
MVSLKLNLKIRNRIMADLDFLLKCASKKDYEVATTALIKLWTDENNPMLTEFATYFKDYWTNKYSWIAVVGSGPRTNNGLEAINNVLKQKFIKEKVSVRECIQNLCDFLDYVVPLQPVPLKPISAEQFKNAYKYRSSRPTIKVIQPDVFFVVESSQCKLTRAEKEQLLRKMFNNDPEKKFDFDDLQEFQANFYYVKKSNIFDNFTCNCPKGALRERCKHAILIGAETKLYRWPQDIRLQTTEFNNGKSQPGRKRKRTGALVID